MAQYWIKLYQEILRDPKMGKLSDSAFRRAIELMLLAGDQSERNGALPAVEDIAWTLRIDEEQLAADLDELQAAGIVELRDTQLFVTNFEKRQAAVSSTERVQRHRKRKQRERYSPPDETQTEPPGNDTETDTTPDRNDVETNRYTDTETDTETETDTTARVRANVVVGGVTEVITAYENEIGTVSPIIRRNIETAVGEFGGQYVLDAIGVAAQNNKRKWSYVQGVLENWHREGRHAARDGPAANGGGDQAFAVLLEAIRQNSYRTLPDAIKTTLKRMGKGTHDLRTMPEREIPFFRKQFMDSYHGT